MKTYLKGWLKRFFLIGILQNDEIRNKNLRRTIENRATEETVDYIQSRMLNVKSFSNKWEVLDYALNKTPLQGLYLEFGVFKGKTISYIAKKINPNTIYGFDSFQGLPEKWNEENDKGTFKLDVIPKVPGNVILKVGWFNQTISDFINGESPESIAFLHVDSDLYSSAKTIFDQLGALFRNGTVIVFDEYFNYPGWKDHEFKAFHEFIKDSSFSYIYLCYNYNHEQVAVQLIQK